MIDRSSLGQCVVESIDDQHHALRGILLLEDSPGEAELFCEALRRAEETLGFSQPPRSIPLITAHTAGQALAWLRTAAERGQTFLPVVVIADLNLPGNSGELFLREVRNDSRLRALPLIAMMWSSEDQAGLTLGDGDPVDFMIKPVVFDDLVGQLRSILERWFRYNNLL
jgi:CheY-like chemotaxis protein